MRISDWSSDVCSSDLKAAASQSLEAVPCSQRDEARGRPGDFDFYMLAFSWSPAFCATDAGARSPGQCRDNAFGWVVHGLWPQYAKGPQGRQAEGLAALADRKSTRLNSSH